MTATTAATTSGAIIVLAILEVIFAQTNAANEVDVTRTCDATPSETDLDRSHAARSSAVRIADVRRRRSLIAIHSLEATSSLSRFASYPMKPRC